MKFWKNLKYNSDGHINVENLMAMKFDQVLSCYLIQLKWKLFRLKRILATLNVVNTFLIYSIANRVKLKRSSKIKNVKDKFEKWDYIVLFGTLAVMAFPTYLLFSHSVLPESLWPHEQQQTRLLCPLLSPRGHSNSCPSSRWCHETISSSVIPFLLLP